MRGQAQTQIAWSIGALADTFVGMQIETKLPKVKTTIFTVMSQLANEHKAINLSQGFPDFSCPERLIDRVTHHMRAGSNQYAPMVGALPLRQAIAEKTLSLYGVSIDPNTEVTVTSGATEALFAAISAVIRPGDEVICFDPSYDSYEPAIDLSGGRAIRLGLKAPEYKIDWQQVKAAITSKTRMIMINTPHNPTGSIWSASDLASLDEITRGTDIFVLSDEVYEHIVFDGEIHQSVLRSPTLRERSFVVSSFGKTYHTTGWKLGYCVAPPAMSAELRKTHQYITFSTVTPMQLGVADFIREDPNHYLSLGAFYQEKRDLFLRGIQGSRFKPLPCKGTYFQLLDYSAITDEDDVSFARRMTIENGLASIPVSVFFADQRDEKVLRFCFAKGEETLTRATDILRRL
jgi:methionine aminotransferase